MTRRFDVGRGLTVAATGGAYASTLRLSGLDSPTTSASRTGAEAGVLAGLQLDFGALGGHFAIGPNLAIPVASPGPLGGQGALPYMSKTRNRSFVTFSF